MIAYFSDVKKVIVILCIFLISLDLVSQESDYKPYFEQRQKISLKGMRVLRTWSLVSLGTGIAGGLNSEGQSQYFHLMNTLWGGANLLVSSVAIKNIKRDQFLEDPGKLEMQQKQLEMTHLINSGFDALIIGLGAGMVEYSKNENVQTERMEGYAYSVILQGSVLFVFDLTMYLLHKRNRKKRLTPLMENYDYNWE